MLKAFTIVENYSVLQLDHINIRRNLAAMTTSQLARLLKMLSQHPSWPSFNEEATLQQLQNAYAEVKVVESSRQPNSSDLLTFHLVFPRRLGIPGGLFSWYLPEWEDNSCLVDVIIGARVLIDSGLCNADQLTVDELERLLVAHQTAADSDFQTVAGDVTQAGTPTKELALAYGCRSPQRF